LSELLPRIGGLSGVPFVAETIARVISATAGAQNLSGGISWLTFFTAVERAKEPSMRTNVAVAEWEILEFEQQALRSPVGRQPRRLPHQNPHHCHHNGLNVK